jgi:hypothetical protein
MFLGYTPLKSQNHEHLEGLQDLEKDAERKGYAAIEGQKTYHRYVDGLFIFFQRNHDWGLRSDFASSTWLVLSCLGWMEENSKSSILMGSYTSNLLM